MDDANKPEGKGGEEEISPAMRELIKYKATGKSASHEIPLPEDAKRAQRFLQEWHAEHEAQQQGPERFIGPRNPDHPNVNRDPGGRTPA